MMFVTKQLTVVLIHGFTNKPTDFGYWKNTLEDEGFNIQTIPYFTGDTVYNSIKSYSHAIYQIIKEIDKKTPIVLIGFSLGGLALRYYFQNLYTNNRNIKFIFTIATPHRGTSIASWGVVGGLIADFVSHIIREKPLLKKPISKTTVSQMTPFSSFIRELNSPSTQYRYEETSLLNIWLEHDGVIIPATNALFPFPEGKNFLIQTDLSHIQVLKSSGTNQILINTIIPILKNKVKLTKKGPQTVEEWEKRS